MKEATCDRSRWDVHCDFCEVAIKDESGLRLAGKVRTAVAELQLFAQSLAPDDQVALATSEPAGAKPDRESRS